MLLISSGSFAASARNNCLDDDFCLKVSGRGCYENIDDDWTKGRYKEDYSSSYIKCTSIKGDKNYICVEADSYNTNTKRPDFSKRTGRIKTIRADYRDVYLINYIKEDGSKYGCIYAHPPKDIGYHVTAEGVWSPDSV